MADNAGLITLLRKWRAEGCEADPEELAQNWHELEIPPSFWAPLPEPPK